MSVLGIERGLSERRLKVLSLPAERMLIMLRRLVKQKSHQFFQKK